VSASESSGSSTSSNGAGPQRGPSIDIDRPPLHPFSRRLWQALRRRAERELLLDLRVGVLLAEGFAREEVARRLHVPLIAVRESCDRIAAASDYLERDTGEDVPQPFRGRA
jgi:hypothetical protein